MARARPPNGGVKKEVVVIIHQRKLVGFNLGKTADFLQKIEKYAPMGIIKKYRPPRQTAVHDVIPCAVIFNAKGAGHQRLV